VQCSVFKTNKKGKSNTHSVAPDQVLDSSGYPRGRRKAPAGMPPLRPPGRRGSKEALVFKTKPRKLKSKLCFLTADFQRKSCSL